jgi:hypothetical protein
VPVGCTTLVITYTLDCSDTFLFSQDPSVYWGVWEPKQNTNAYDDGKAAKKEVDYLVVGDDFPAVEGDAICDEAAKYLGQTWQNLLTDSTIERQIGCHTILQCSNINEFMN